MHLYEPRLQVTNKQELRYGAIICSDLAATFKHLMYWAAVFFSRHSVANFIPGRFSFLSWPGFQGTCSTLTRKLHILTISLFGFSFSLTNFEFRKKTELIMLSLEHHDQNSEHEVQWKRHAYQNRNILLIAGPRRLASSGNIRVVQTRQLTFSSWIPNLMSISKRPNLPILIANWKNKILFKWRNPSNFEVDDGIRE